MRNLPPLPLGVLLATAVGAFILQLFVRPAMGELIPATDSQITIEFGAEPEHSYHWWDALTSGASGLFAPKIDDTYSALDEAQKKAYMAGEYVTDNAAQFGNEVKENVKHAGDRAQRKAEHYGRKAQHDAAHLTKQAKENVQQAGNTMKQKGQNAYSKVDAEGRRVANEAEHVVDRNVQYGSGYLHGMFGKISRKIWSFISTTRGASSHLNAELKSGLEKLGNMVGSLNDGGSPSWPEAVFEGTRDQSFSHYIHDLGRASQVANDQIRKKLDIHTEMLASMAKSHLSSRLRLSGCYIPILVLISLYTMARNCCRSARHNQRTATEGDRKRSSGNHGPQSLEQGGVGAGVDALATTSANLGVLSLASVLLAVMEFNGVAGWLVASCYTALVAGIVAAAEPSFLAGVISSDNTAGAGLRLAIGVTAVSAVSCLIHTFFC
ncbi:hypothetical protein H4S06_002894 [Coemansia sp. BCRC 34490]|nr:hypothetical protein H4S06_002894 [Coemansia sp. BCRC 34490]